MLYNEDSCHSCEHGLERLILRNEEWSLFIVKYLRAELSPLKQKWNNATLNIKALRDESP